MVEVKSGSVAKNGILSQDLGIFLSSGDVFGIFLNFLKREAWNLEIDFLVKLTNKQFC